MERVVGGMNFGRALVFAHFYHEKRGWRWYNVIIRKEEVYMITLDIDLLNYRTYVTPNKVYYDRPQRKGKHHVRGCDYHYKANQLVTFNKRTIHSRTTYAGTRYLVNGSLLKEELFTKLLKQGKITPSKVQLVGTSRKYKVKKLYIVTC